jgi:hypothetical protein
MSYVVEKTLSGLGCSKLVEPEINHLASEYIVEHYESIKAQARKMVGVDANKVEDLVHDVMESILIAENNGNGYSMDHSREGSIITVADFVYGRLKLYSKNRKYSSEGCDRHVSTKRVNGEMVTVVDFDIAYASPDNSKDVEDMTGMQRAYANASNLVDEMELVEEIADLRRNVEFCIDFDKVVGMNFRNLFEHVGAFDCEIDSSIFDNLREHLKEHDELSEALFQVLNAAVKHRAVFDTVMQSL